MSPLPSASRLPPAPPARRLRPPLGILGECVDRVALGPAATLMVSGSGVSFFAAGAIDEAASRSCCLRYAGFAENDSVALRAHRSGCLGRQASTPPLRDVARVERRVSDAGGGRVAVLAALWADQLAEHHGRCICCRLVSGRESRRDRHRRGYRRRGAKSGRLAA